MANRFSVLGQREFPRILITASVLSALSWPPSTAAGPATPAARETPAASGATAQKAEAWRAVKPI
jgi:hypothetical protein